jgi:hypothetical protein
MTNFDELKSTRDSNGPAAAIERLIDHYRETREHFPLFQALLLREKHALGIPVARPIALDDVPEDQRLPFEERYIAAAREIGEMLLAEGRIPDAWMYFRQIREPGPIRAALDAISARRDLDDETEQLLSVALYEGAHPVKGLEIMLHTHGTCNTITAYGQQAQQLPAADQARAAELLVGHLYEELTGTVRREVEQRMPMLPPNQSLRELIAGREWLFADGNYHVDVSHLHSVVQFARSLGTGSRVLDRAIQLTEYGEQLDDQFRYPAEPPFEDFYPAHRAFLRAIADDGRDAALGYFRDKLAAEPDEDDRALIAFVLVDLLVRCGRGTEAVDVAAEHLKEVEEATGFSLAQLCQETGRMDRFEQVARERGDLVGFTAALLR